MQTIQEEIENCQSVKVHDCKRECGPQILNQIKHELATCSFLGGPTIKEFQYPQIYGFHAHTLVSPTIQHVYCGTDHAIVYLLQFMDFPYCARK